MAYPLFYDFSNFLIFERYLNNNKTTYRNKKAGKTHKASAF